MLGELDEQVEVASDEVVLGDEHDGVAAFDQDFQALTGNLKFLLQRLIRIRNAGARKANGFVARPGQFSTEQGWGFLLNHDFAFKVKACREAKVFVGGPGIAVGAAVLTASIWVQAGIKRQIRAGMARNDGTAVVAEYLGGHSIWPVLIINNMEGRKALIWVGGGTSTTKELHF